MLNYTLHFKEPLEIVDLTECHDEENGRLEDRPQHNTWVRAFVDRAMYAITDLKKLQLQFINQLFVCFLFYNYRTRNITLSRGFYEHTWKGHKERADWEQQFSITRSVVTHGPRTYKLSAVESSEVTTYTTTPLVQLQKY